MRDAHDLGGTLEVDLEVRLVRAVVHDGGEAGVDALEHVLVGAVVEVQRDGDRDVLGLDQVTHQVGDDLEADLPLGSAARALDDHRRLQLLRSIEDGRRPLEVVRVEGAKGVLAALGSLEHVRCVDKHGLNLSNVESIEASVRIMHSRADGAHRVGTHRKRLDNRYTSREARVFRRTARIHECAR